MALWGNFGPVGYALANLQAGLLPADWFVGLSLLSFVIPIAALSSLAALTLSIASEAASHPPGRSRISQAGVFIAAAFGFYVYLSIGFFTFLPRHMAGLGQHSLPFPAMIALCVPAGGALAAMVLAFLGARTAGDLAFCGFLIAAVAGSLAFSDTRTDMVVMPLFALAGGVAASGLFACVPVLARTETDAMAVVGAVA